MERPMTQREQGEVVTLHMEPTMKDGDSWMPGRQVAMVTGGVVQGAEECWASAQANGDSSAGCPPCTSCHQMLSSGLA